MKQKRGVIRNFSTEDLDRLVLSIISGTGDSEEDLNKRLKRNKGYITQVRSRYNKQGKAIPRNLILMLEEELKKKTAKSIVDRTVDEATLVRAWVTVLTSAVARLMSSSQGRSIDGCIDELDQNLRLTLRDMLKS